MDIRENSTKEIAKILVEKCKTISKNETANQIGGNNQTCILSRNSRYVLGIIATSVFSSKYIKFSKIFTNIKWKQELNLLSRKGLVIKQKDSLNIPKKIKDAIFGDSEDVKEFNQAWIKVLEPFKDHIDVAIMLSLHYLHNNEFNQAVLVSTNIA